MENILINLMFPVANRIAFLQSFNFKILSALFGCVVIVVASLMTQGLVSISLETQAAIQIIIFLYFIFQKEMGFSALRKIEMFSFVTMSCINYSNLSFNLASITLLMITLFYLRLREVQLTSFSKTIFATIYLSILIKDNQHFGNYVSELNSLIYTGLCLFIIWLHIAIRKSKSFNGHSMFDLIYYLYYTYWLMQFAVNIDYKFQLTILTSILVFIILISKIINKMNALLILIILQTAILEKSLLFVLIMLSLTMIIDNIIYKREKSNNLFLQLPWQSILVPIIIYQCLDKSHPVFNNLTVLIIGIFLLKSLLKESISSFGNKIYYLGKHR